MNTPKMSRKKTGSISFLLWVWLHYWLFELLIIPNGWWIHQKCHEKKRAAFRFYYGFDCVIDYLSVTIPNGWWIHQKCHENKRAAFRFYYGFECIIDYLILWFMNNGQKLFGRWLQQSYPSRSNPDDKYECSSIATPCEGVQPHVRGHPPREKTRSSRIPLTHSPFIIQANNRIRMKCWVETVDGSCWLVEPTVTVGGIASPSSAHQGDRAISNPTLS